MLENLPKEIFDTLEEDNMLYEKDLNWYVDTLREQILKCPHCNGAASLILNSDSSSYVRCKCCGAETKRVPFHPLYSSAELAIYKWNRRIK